VCGLSPDGRAVAVLLEPEQAFKALALLPTGAGEVKRMPAGSIRYFFEARWLPDGKRLLIAGNEEGRPRRLFLQDLDGGSPRPITPERISTDYPIPSPDGKWVAAGADWRATPYTLHSVEGGESRPIAGLEKGEQPLRFDADGAHLFLRTDKQDSPLARIERLDLRSGRKEPWRIIRPLDPGGVAKIGWMYLTPDGRSYVYNYERSLSTLYLVNGLK